MVTHGRLRHTTKCSANLIHIQLPPPRKEENNPQACPISKQPERSCALFFNPPPIRRQETIKIRICNTDKVPPLAIRIIHKRSLIHSLTKVKNTHTVPFPENAERFQVRSLASCGKTLTIEREVHRAKIGS